MKKKLKNINISLEDKNKRINYFLIANLKHYEDKYGNKYYGFDIYKNNERINYGVLFGVKGRDVDKFKKQIKEYLKKEYMN